MIARVEGTLVARELDRVEIFTVGGVTYELAIPLSVFEGLPAVGEAVALHTELIVRDDGWQLYGFANAFERRVFARLMTATGVGPALALGILSALSAERVVRAVRDGDVAALQGVPRVGRKKAERLVLELADKMDDLGIATAGPGGGPRTPSADDAARALVSLGYSQGEADQAVRAALDDGGRGLDAPALIRLSLSKVKAR
ncbi:MAG TPA: Holliday junction branch migration protein RuvA [Gemmatimonadaceae bacterium]|nr:Holliday junction branch migration protein RuvA [Gemmatimonadaceae bacterium]